MALPVRPADRYGDSLDDGARSRRGLLALFAGFVVVVIAFATWVAVERNRTAVGLIELGLSRVSDSSATLTFQVDLPAAASAVCTVSMVNGSSAEVGRQDVLVGPAQNGSIRAAATVVTSERASGGRVTSCARR